MEPNEITSEIISAAIAVHKALGPGLLESAYEACLAHELRKRGLRLTTQVLLPVTYDGQQIDAGYRIDLIVEETVLVELKAVEQLTPIHDAQILTYMKLSGKSLGLMLNLNVELLKDGIRRFVRNFKG